MTGSPQTPASLRGRDNRHSTCACDIVWSFLRSWWRIRQLSPGTPGSNPWPGSADRTGHAHSRYLNFTTRRAVSFRPPPTWHRELSTTQMDFAGGDGWMMPQDYAMYVLSPPFARRSWRSAARCWASMQRTSHSPRPRRQSRDEAQAQSLPLLRQTPDGNRRDASAASDPSRERGRGTDPGAGSIRYVLIPFDSKETSRLITGVESTFEEVTVDSLYFKPKNELGTRWPMIRAVPALARSQHSGPRNDHSSPDPRTPTPPRVAAAIESP